MFKEVIELHGWLSCIKLPSRRAQRTEASLPKRTHPGEVRGCSYRKVLESDNQIKIRRAKGERGRFSHQQRTLTMTVCCCPLPVRSNVQTSPEVVRLTPLLLLLQFGRVTCSPAAYRSREELHQPGRNIDIAPRGDGTPKFNVARSCRIQVRERVECMHTRS